MPDRFDKFNYSDGFSVPNNIKLANKQIGTMKYEKSIASMEASRLSSRVF